MMIVRLWLILILAVMPVGIAAQTDDPEREGGIIGTGIVGTVTALGSIIVNGQRITFDDSLEIAAGVTLAHAADLRPGHRVAVIARRDGPDWRAQVIRQIVPLVGPISRGADGTLRILGTVFTIPPDAPDLRPGDWVAVSGLWQSDRVIGTRIEYLHPEAIGQARIEGSVFLADPVSGTPASLRVGQTRISGLIPRHLSDGDVVRATGSARGDVLAAATLATGVFETRLDTVLAEGYLSPPRPSGLYTVLGADIVSFTDNPGMIDPEARQIACGLAGRITQMMPADGAAAEIAGGLAACLPD